MKHEELIDKIDEQIMENRYMRYPCFSKSDCTTKLRESNNLLGRIKTVLKTAGKEYERGCEDAWEFCRKLELYEHDGGFDIDMQREVFGDGYLIQNIVFDHESYKEAVTKVEAYEQKKMREQRDVMEAEKPVVGDVVEVVCSCNDSVRYKGVYISERITGHIILTEGQGVMELNGGKGFWKITKTGKRFDNIQEILDEIKEE